MYDMMKKQKFGVEIELTGITRRKAAQVIANHFGTEVHHPGGSYDTYSADDGHRRRWKAMSDGSIRTEKKQNGQRVRADNSYSCEVVTPVLKYDDLEDLQNIIRELREAGAIANASCGIHVHVDGANHTAASLTRLMNFAIGRQDLFYEALQIGERADRWCQKMNRSLFKAMKKDTEKTKDSLERIWYSAVNDGYCGGIDHRHYNSSRYHGVNLHAFFTKGTVEFRLFNGTTHAGKIKAYVQFCLAMSAWAINCEDNDLYFRSIKNLDKEQRGKLMNNVLKNRLGLRGKEFKTCREHLTAAFLPATEEQSEVA